MRLMRLARVSIADQKVTAAEDITNVRNKFTDTSTFKTTNNFDQATITAANTNCMVEVVGVFTTSRMVFNEPIISIAACPGTTT